MARRAFDPTAEDLPTDIPIFPLAGALLLPGGQLPLNIFELRYLNMVADALGQGRYLGMVQPRVLEAVEESPKLDDAPIYSVGCLGRITSFEETSDGRFLISLHGLIRFGVGPELPLEKGYRRLTPNFGSYLGDLLQSPTTVSGADEQAPGRGENWIDRARLIGSVKQYFAAQDLSAEWKGIDQASDDVLVTTLAMVCPLSPPDRQALLESPTNVLRAKMLVGLLEAALASDDAEPEVRH